MEFDHHNPNAQDNVTWIASFAPSMPEHPTLLHVLGTFKIAFFSEGNPDAEPPELFLCDGSYYARAPANEASAFSMAALRDHALRSPNPELSRNLSLLLQPFLSPLAPESRQLLEAGESPERFKNLSKAEASAALGTDLPEPEPLLDFGLGDAVQFGKSLANSLLERVKAGGDLWESAKEAGAAMGERILRRSNIEATLSIRAFEMTLRQSSAPGITYQVSLRAPEGTRSQPRVSTALKNHFAKACSEALGPDISDETRQAIVDGLAVLGKTDPEAERASFAAWEASRLQNASDNETQPKAKHKPGL